MKLLLVGLLLLASSNVVYAQASSVKGSDAFDAEEVSIKTNGYALAGTLLLPRSAKRPVAAAITITGSGLQTRDGAIPMKGLENYRPFKQIAEELAGLGIAVLRVDDRGVGSSTGRETLEAATTSTLAEDTRAQVAYLRGRREIDPDRIALIGHSEGGSIAMMVAASDERIRAVVLMATMGKTGMEVNLSQQEAALAQMPGLTEERKAELRAQQRQTLRTIMEGGDLSKYPAEVRHPWFKEFLSFDPLPLVRKLRQPIMILQGSLDTQITPDQAAMLERAAREAGNKDVTVRVFTGLNHLFLPAKTGAWSEYSTPITTDLSREVLNALGGWLERRLRKK